MTKLRTVVVLACLCAPVAAPAGNFMSGNELFMACRAGNYFQAGDCLGYVSGAGDMLLTAAKFGLIPPHAAPCLPPDTTREQVRDVVLAFLIRHPEERHHTASSLVNAAILEVFPCGR